MGVGMGGYPDEQLLQQARDDAFHGIMMVTALSGEVEIKKDLREHFTAILEAIDGN